MTKEQLGTELSRQLNEIKFYAPNFGVFKDLRHIEVKFIGKSMTSFV